MPLTSGNPGNKINTKHSEERNSVPFFGDILLNSSGFKFQMDADIPADEPKFTNLLRSDSLLQITANGQSPFGGSNC